MSEEKSKKPRSGRGLFFFLGAMVGATTAYFLTTEEGTKWRKETAKRTGEFTNRVKDLVQDQVGQLAQNVESNLRKGKEMVENFGTEEQLPIEDFTHNPVNSNESSFQRGMRKAKRDLDEQNG